MKRTIKSPSLFDISRALFVDMIRRSWFVLIIGFFGAFSLPLLILGALKAKGALLVEDSGMILIHFTFAQVMGMCFGASVLHAAGAPSRLYVLPLSNRAIMVIQMVPATLMVIGQTALSIWILNLIFGLNWPLLGNALAFGMIFANFQSMMNLFQKSLLMLPAMILTLTLESFWVKSRHGPIFSLPTQYWTTVTPMDWLVFAFAMTLSYWIGMYAIYRSRCGNEIQTSLIVYLSNLIQDLFGKTTKAFRNAVQAQSWYEWNLKGYIFPVIVGMVVPLTPLFWLFSERKITALLEVLRVEGWLLSVAGMCSGLILGNMGLSDASIMGQFLGTKPLATVPWSRILLRTAFQSLSLGVLIWAIIFSLVLWGGKLAGESYPAELFPWWYFPAIVLAAWAAMTFALCVSLTGRTIHMKILGGAYCGWLIVFTTIGNITSKWIAELFYFCALSGFGIALFLLTIGIWGVAFRRNMVVPRHAIVAGIVLTGLIGLAGWQFSNGLPLPTNNHGITPYFLLVSGLLSMVVFPFAAAPLALAWNRTR